LEKKNLSGAGVVASRSPIGKRLKWRVLSKVPKGKRVCCSVVVDRKLRQGEVGRKQSSKEHKDALYKLGRGSQEQA